MNKYPIYKAVYPISIIDGFEKDIAFFRVLSKREINNLYSLYSNSKFAFMINTLKISLSDEKIIDELSDKEIENIYTTIMELSIPTNKHLTLLKDVFNLSNDNALQSDTWSCEVCKERNLQKVRACGYLPEEERDKSFQIYAGGAIHKICPIYKVQKYNDLMSSAYEGYKYYRKGLMPEPGGMYDQTSWFIELSLKLDNLIKIKQAEDIKKDN